MLLAIADMRVRGSDVGALMIAALAGLAGRTDDDMEAFGERIFRDGIAGMVYPGARELVRAHRRAGHTLVIATSATRYQVEPLARDLEMDGLLCTHAELRDGVLTGGTDGPDPVGRREGRRGARLRRRARHRPRGVVRVRQRGRGGAAAGVRRPARGRSTPRTGSCAWRRPTAGPCTGCSRRAAASASSPCDPHGRGARGDGRVLRDRRRRPAAQPRQADGRERRHRGRPVGGARAGRGRCRTSRARSTSPPRGPRSSSSTTSRGSTCW